MNNRRGIIRKVKHTYPLAHGRGGAEVDILACGHAVLCGSMGGTAKGHKERKCGLCAKEQQEKLQKMASTPEHRKALRDLVRLAGGTEAVLEMLAKEEANNRVWRENAKKARAARAQKHGPPLALAVSN